MSDNFTVFDNTEYTKDRYGVIHQVNPQPISYDAAYVAKHTSKPNYHDNSLLLNGLRLGFIVGGIGRVPNSLLDYGYGDGSFASFAAKVVPAVMAYDIAATPAPEGCRRVEDPNIPVEVVTYWDSLEHTVDLDKAIAVNARYVALSVPCRPHSRFQDWHHRRPNEHLHHFDEASLLKWMESKGWRVRAIDFPEDAVRGGHMNILSALFYHNTRF